MVTAELKESMCRLVEAEAGLQRASNSAEQQFLKVGRALERMTTLSQNLVNESNKLVGLSAGHSDDAVPAGTRLVNGLLVFLQSGHDTVTQLIRELEQQHEQIGQLRRMDKTLQQTIAPLHFMRVLFKIESSALPSAAQERFRSLAGEIDRLNTEVKEIVGTQFEMLLGTEKSIAALIDRLRVQTARQQTLVSAKQNAIAKSLDELDREMQMYQQREAKLQRASQEIAQEVCEVVMGLQGQDNVTQRIQHVRRALQEMMALQPDEPSDGDAASAFSACVYLGSRIESGQVEAIRNLLSPAQTRIVSGIQHVESLVKNINDECLSLAGGVRVTAAVETMVQVLLDTLAEMHGLVATAVAQAEECQRAVQPLGSITTNLMSAVRTLATEMHWMGINAEVQALRVPDGHGLEVLSDQASQIASQTNQLSRTAAAELDNLGVSLAKCIGGFEQMFKWGQEKQQELSSEGQTVQGLLRAFRDRTVAALNQVHGMLDSICQNAAEAMGTLTFEKTIAPHLDRLHTTLGHIADQCPPPAEPLPAEVKEWLRLLEKNYTMVQERDLHARVVAACGHASAEKLNSLEEHVLVGGASANILGDNIELF